MSTGVVSQAVPLYLGDGLEFPDLPQFIFGKQEPRRGGDAVLGCLPGDRGHLKELFQPDVLAAQAAAAAHEHPGPQLIIAREAASRRGCQWFPA